MCNLTIFIHGLFTLIANSFNACTVTDDMDETRSMWLWQDARFT